MYKDRHLLEGYILQIKDLIKTVFTWSHLSSSSSSSSSSIQPHINKNVYALELVQSDT